MLLEIRQVAVPKLDLSSIADSNFAHVRLELDTNRETQAFV
jgi:hypothetical protein